MCVGVVEANLQIMVRRTEVDLIDLDSSFSSGWWMRIYYAPC